MEEVTLSDIKEQILREMLKNLSSQNYDAVSILSAAYQRLSSI